MAGFRPRWPLSVLDGRRLAHVNLLNRVIDLCWWILAESGARDWEQELETRNQGLGTILSWDLLWHYTMECLRLIAQTICGYSTFLSEVWQMRTLFEARIRVESCGRSGKLHKIIKCQ